MKRILYLIAIIFLAGCAQNDYTEIVYSNDSTIQVSFKLDATPKKYTLNPGESLTELVFSPDIASYYGMPCVSTVIDGKTVSIIDAVPYSVNIINTTNVDIQILESSGFMSAIDVPGNTPSSSPIITSCKSGTPAFTLETNTYQVELSWNLEGNTIYISIHY